MSTTKPKASIINKRLEVLEQGRRQPTAVQTQRMSCFLCGAFRLGSELKFRLLIHRYQKVCAPRFSKG